MSGIPLYGCTLVCLSIHWVMDLGVASSFCFVCFVCCFAVMNKAAMNISRSSLHIDAHLHFPRANTEAESRGG